MYIHVTQNRISWFCSLPVNYTNYTCLRTSRHLNNDDSPRQVTKSTIYQYARVLYYFYLSPQKILILLLYFSNHMWQHFPRWPMQQNPSPASPVIQHSSTARIHRCFFFFVFGTQSQLFHRLEFCATSIRGEQ